MTPPPALSAAEPLPAAGPVDSKINRDLLAVMDGVSPGYFLLLGTTILGVTAAAITWIYQIYIGLGIAGYTHPLFWGVYIVTFGSARMAPGSTLLRSLIRNCRRG